MKKKLCKWLYEHGMEWLAWRISPSITCYVISEIYTECFKKALDEGIKSVLPDECNNCGEYHDYHCDKFCKIIRETIDDLKDYYKDAIPIEDIQYYAEKAENPEIAEALLEVIYRHKDAQEKQDDIFGMQEKG